MSSEGFWLRKLEALKYKRQHYSESSITWFHTINIILAMPLSMKCKAESSCVRRSFHFHQFISFFPFRRLDIRIVTMVRIILMVRLILVRKGKSDRQNDWEVKTSKVVLVIHDSTEFDVAKTFGSAVSLSSNLDCVPFYIDVHPEKSCAVI